MLSKLPALCASMLTVITQLPLIGMVPPAGSVTLLAPATAITLPPHVVLAFGRMYPHIYRPRRVLRLALISCATVLPLSKNELN